MRLLVVLTVRKSIDLTRRASAKKEEQCHDVDIAHLFSKEPSPELATEVADEVSRWMDQLQDDELW